MRAPLKRKSKLRPRWEGPFVVLDSTEKDVYQLATANGYILKTSLTRDSCKDWMWTSRGDILVTSGRPQID